MSSPGEHMINTTVLDQSHTSVTNLPAPKNMLPHNTAYNNMSLELQLTGAIMRTALIVKQNNVSLGVEYYDALNYKLLRINVTNSLQL